MENNFDEVVESLQKLKGITKKSAERIVADLVSFPEEIDEIINSFLKIKTTLGECPICFYLTINNVCPICSDDRRNQELICVVSSFLDARTIEETHSFNGVYAVLKGEINLSKKIGPDKLKIKELFNRINKETELILALNSTFHGELTANYLRDLARERKINYSRLAKGMPSGGVLDYVDEKTLISALKNRNKND